MNNALPKPEKEFEFVDNKKNEIEAIINNIIYSKEVKD